MNPTKFRILMFAPECFPPAGAESIVTGKLLIAALKSGWKIDVISHKNSGQYYPSNPNGCWSVIKKTLRSIDTIELSRFRSSLKAFPVLNLFSRLESLIWVIKAVAMGRRLLKQNSYDFILSRIMPEYGHLPALILSYSFNIPWIANWSDPMPREKAPAPFAQGISSKIPFLKSIYCQKVANNATWHTFPSERLRKYVCSYLPVCEAKSSVVPHIALKKFQFNSPRNDVAFSFCHVGSLGIRNPDVFLEGLKQFLQITMVDRPFSVKFVGVKLVDLIEKVQKLGLEDIVSIEEAKTYEETLKIMANSRILVVIEAESEEGIFLPSKFVDCVQTGRPILAVSPTASTLADIISMNGGGIAADCSSSTAVSEAIKTLYIEWKAGTLDDKYGSSRLFHLFSEQKVISEYLELFGRINRNRFA